MYKKMETQYSNNSARFFRKVELLRVLRHLRVRLHSIKLLPDAFTPLTSEDVGDMWLKLFGSIRVKVEALQFWHALDTLNAWP